MVPLRVAPGTIGGVWWVVLVALVVIVLGIVVMSAAAIRGMSEFKESHADEVKTDGQNWKRLSVAGSGRRIRRTANIRGAVLDRRDTLMT